MTQLQRLDCSGNLFGVDEVRAFQPGLQANRTLRELNLSSCSIRTEIFRLIVDALVCNAIIKVLNFTRNDISYPGLADVVRLFESTQITRIAFCWNYSVFSNDDATQCFVTALQHKKSTLQELRILKRDLPEGSRDAICADIRSSLIRNKQLNRVDLFFLALRPPPQQSQQRQRQQQQSGAATSMMRKISLKEITKFAAVSNKAGASALFKLYFFSPSPTTHGAGAGGAAANVHVAISRKGSSASNSRTQASSSASESTNSNPQSTSKRQRL
jgi:hypothetical protein